MDRRRLLDKGHYDCKLTSFIKRVTVKKRQIERERERERMKLYFRQLALTTE